ncbi:growth-regulating factor 9-like isoform X2 [Tripterygium wilfordii]|nr:growth-regulating factor 9-like isoform X2 [Tripterygium wilfordii]
MEVQRQRTASPSVSDGGSRGRGDVGGTAKMEGENEGQPSIKLCLSSGADPSPRTKPVMMKHEKPVFTPAQLHELQKQALVFKYIAAGLHVPAQLLIPIWKSVVASLGPASGGIYKQFPSFVGFSPEELDLRTMMDPEPGRCRRTDGKKWRCSRSVVPHQKYCERHMHRGCRSRKLVEASQLASPPDATPPNKSKGDTENSNTNHSLEQTSSKNDGISFIGGRDDITTIEAPPIYASTSFNTRCCSNITNHNSNYMSHNSIINRKRMSEEVTIAGNGISLGFGFSPKSVLQVVGSTGLSLGKSDLELEVGRCRRTDGKKWRCHRDVVPYKKYCRLHMHRGSKKHIEVSIPSAAAASGTSGLPPISMLPNKEDSRGLNTCLSMSITRPQGASNDEKCDTSGSSDTTISDTMTCYEISNFSS